MANKKKSPGGAGRGRPRMYKDDAEKVAEFKKRHKVQVVRVEVKDEAPINKPILQAAANALELPLSQFIMQAATKHIIDQLGSEWLEDQQNKGKE